MIKTTRLTRFNMDALRELVTEEELTRVAVGGTVATLDMDASKAQRLLATLQQRATQRSGTGGHPYKSLFAVARKISAHQGRP